MYQPVKTKFKKILNIQYATVCVNLHFCAGYKMFITIIVPFVEQLINIMVPVPSECGLIPSDACQV